MFHWITRTAPSAVLSRNVRQLLTRVPESEPPSLPPSFEEPGLPELEPVLPELLDVPEVPDELELDEVPEAAGVVESSEQA